MPECMEFVYHEEEFINKFSAEHMGILNPPKVGGDGFYGLGV